MKIKYLKELAFKNEILLLQKKDGKVILRYLSLDEIFNNDKEIVSIEALDFHLIKVEVKDNEQKF